jgi:hypothetical protein
VNRKRRYTFRLFRNLRGIVNLDSGVAHGAFRATKAIAPLGVGSDLDQNGVEHPGD